MEEKQGKLSEVWSLLAQFTNGFSDSEKKEFVKTLGFASIDEIKALNLEDIDILVKKLNTKPKREYVTKNINGYIVSHPKSGRYTVSDVSFTFGRAKKTYKERYG